ncbi:uncharacterized protein [Acropora muricata]|uniref:uncharacterized protein n=1 Tax=Acropora muricata TaxID=159855 RepID=UPI0034E4F6A7
MAVYNACVISTLLYWSEAWTTYKQERKVDSFHLRSLRGILGISWRDKVPKTEVLDRAALPTMYTLLRQRIMHWIGHLRCMEDGRIPKDILYGELATGKRPRGRPQLRYKDHQTKPSKKGLGEKRKQQLTPPHLSTSAPHAARTPIPALAS